MCNLPGDDELLPLLLGSDVLDDEEPPKKAANQARPKRSPRAPRPAAPLGPQPKREPASKARRPGTPPSGEAD